MQALIPPGLVDHSRPPRPCPSCANIRPSVGEQNAGSNDHDDGGEAKDSEQQAPKAGSDRAKADEAGTAEGASSEGASGDAAAAAEDADADPVEMVEKVVTKRVRLRTTWTAPAFARVTEGQKAEVLQRKADLDKAYKLRVEHSEAFNGLETLLYRASELLDNPKTSFTYMSSEEQSTYVSLPGPFLSRPGLATLTRP